MNGSRPGCLVVLLTGGLCGRGRREVVARVPLDGASDVAVSRDGVVYIARLAAGLARADLPALDVTPVAACGAAMAVAFAPDGATAYVAGLGAPLALVDVATSAVVAGVGAEIILATPLACAVTADGGTVALGVGGAVYTIDVIARDVSPSIAIPGGVDHLTVHPMRSLFYATASSAGRVLEVDARTRTVVRTFTLGGTPGGSAVSHDGATLYVANGDGHLDVVALATAMVARAPLGVRGALGTALTPDGTRLYVTSPWAGTVLVVDVASSAVTDSIAVGGEPRGVAVSPDGCTVVVANERGWVDLIR